MNDLKVDDERVACSSTCTGSKHRARRHPAPGGPPDNERADDQRRGPFAEALGHYDGPSTPSAHPRVWFRGGAGGPNQQLELIRASIRAASVSPDRVARPLRFGIMVFPQSGSIALIEERWRRAEAMAFDDIWIADQTAMAYPGILGHEAWSLLGALAKVTTRVGIGTMVSPVALRHPLVLAMSVSTVDHLSGGRVTLGIGAGGAPKDDDGVGVFWTPGQRIEHFEAQVEIVDALLRGETVTREAGPYRLKDARVEAPLQRPRPPIQVAAQGPRGIRLAAKYADVWNSLGGQPIYEEIPMVDALAVTRKNIALLDEACVASGRDPTQVRRSVFIWNYDECASIDALAEYVGRYHELGVDEFHLSWPRSKDGISPSREREAILERIAGEVIASLRG